MIKIIAAGNDTESKDEEKISIQIGDCVFTEKGLLDKDNKSIEGSVDFKCLSDDGKDCNYDEFKSKVRSKKLLGLIATFDDGSEDDKDNKDEELDAFTEFSYVEVQDISKYLVPNKYGYCWWWDDKKDNKTDVMVVYGNDYYDIETVKLEESSHAEKNRGHAFDQKSFMEDTNFKPKHRQWWAVNDQEKRCKVTKIRNGCKEFLLIKDLKENKYYHVFSSLKCDNCHYWSAYGLIYNKTVTDNPMDSMMNSMKSMMGKLIK